MAGPEGGTAGLTSSLHVQDFDPLRNRESIVDINATIPYRALNLPLFRVEAEPPASFRYVGKSESPWSGATNVRRPHGGRVPKVCGA